MVQVLLYLLGTLLGLMIGSTITYNVIESRQRHNIAGNLVIDRSDPEDGPYIFLELGVDPSILEQSETTTFVVVSKNYISHE